MIASPLHLRAEATAIFRAAVAAVDPTRLVLDYFHRYPAAGPGAQDMRPGHDQLGNVLVVGAGKAAARMALACERIFGAERVRGEVVVADGCAVNLDSVVVTAAGHPLPDTRGEQATRRIVDSLRTQQSDRIICLVSGGASSLLVYPHAPVTLEDKTATTKLLLESGADIHAVNTVRKHLSAVKGGGLLRQARSPILALLLSDVIGDAPSTIGSGPTAPDDTTFADAWDVLLRYQLKTRVPPAVVQVLRDGMAGRVPETVKPGDSAAARGQNTVIGSNHTALDGAAAAARKRGWCVVIEDCPLSGDTTVAAQRFAARIRELSARLEDRKPLCILAGGETTVHVRGSGRGGRNQEFALVAALAGISGTLLSAGTDGIDGPTDAAGAFVDETTLRRAQACHLNLGAALESNDSYAAFSCLGDLFRCGATGTNVMDIKIALVPAQTGESPF
ncbi:MAG: glycerate 2-kinase [Deltaproteobacteria bacterium]|nr:glycerate 2-kinase [Deltaproteobacteria bacterium]